MILATISTAKVMTTALVPYAQPNAETKTLKMEVSREEKINKINELGIQINTDGIDDKISNDYMICYTILRTFRDKS